jgi:hypothetical protein
MKMTITWHEQNLSCMIRSKAEMEAQLARLIAQHTHGIARLTEEIKVASAQICRAKRENRLEFDGDRFNIGHTK